MADLIDRQAAIKMCREPRMRNADCSDFEMEIMMLPSAQPETHEERTETHACDCIERQAAIEAIEEMQMPIMRSMFPEEQFVFKGMSEALSAIKDLPSVQPVAKDIDVPINVNDCISRQYAIRIVDSIDTWQAGWRGDAIESIKALPSAQPEPCKDAVKREDVQSIAEKSDWFESSDSFNDFIWALYELPSAQPEIIRCKDCNHWSRESICDGFCTEDCMRHDEDFYCGYAERKTNE